jgi:nucleoside-diphosphate-sugar epimerase
MLMSDTKASSQFIIKALQGEDIVLKSLGEQFFSYTYVADAVAAMLFVLLNGETGVPYNIANNDCNVHLKDFAQICADISGTKVVYDVPDKVEQAGFSIASKAILVVDRLMTLGYVSCYSIREAIERTINILK